MHWHWSSSLALEDVNVPPTLPSLGLTSPTRPVSSYYTFLIWALAADPRYVAGSEVRVSCRSDYGETVLALCSELEREDWWCHSYLADH